MLIHHVNGIDWLVITAFEELKTIFIEEAGAITADHRRVAGWVRGRCAARPGGLRRLFLGDAESVVGGAGRGAGEQVEHGNAGDGTAGVRVPRSA